MSTSRNSSRLRPPSLVRLDTTGSTGTFANPEAATVPEGPIDESTVEALHEFVHPHHATDATLVEDTENDLIAEDRKRLPWYRRPSPYWWVASTFMYSALDNLVCVQVHIYDTVYCYRYGQLYCTPD